MKLKNILGYLLAITIVLMSFNFAFAGPEVHRTGIFDPSAPGEIGGTTPAAGTFTTLETTGATTLGDDVSLAATKHFVLPQHNDAMTPTLAWGDGDTGFYEYSDDVIAFSVSGALSFFLSITQISGQSSAGPGLQNEASTATNPTLMPSRDDLDTGVGHAAADQISLIAGGVEGIRITEATTIHVNVYGDLEVGAANAFYYGPVSTNDTWKTVRDGTKLSFQRRESGAYVEKGFFDASFHTPDLHSDMLGGIAGSVCLHEGTSPLADPTGARLWVDASHDLYLLQENATPETRVQNKIVREDASGRVGIGGSPSAKLHIYNTLAGESIVIQDDAAGDLALAYIRFKDSSGTLGYLGYAHSSSSTFTIGNEVSNADIYLQTTGASLFGKSSAVGSLTNCESNGSTTITKTSHGSTPSEGDLLHITSSSTPAAEGFYQVQSYGANTIVVDRAVSGTEIDISLTIYQDVAAFITDADGNIRITGYQSDNEPLQIGGLTMVGAGGHSLGAEDVLIGGSLLEINPVVFFDQHFHIAEITTPSAVGNYGAIYTKTDDRIYFQDGAGTEHVINIGASGVKHEFHMPFEDPTGQVGNWDVVTINNAQDTHFVFQISESFETLVNAKVVMIPDASETIQWDINVSVAAAGEAYNNDDDSAADQTLVVTQNQITEVDISGQLTGLAAGDYVAIDFQSDTNDLRIIGFEFDYR